MRHERYFTSDLVESKPTLDTTKQGIFNRVVEHYRNQKRRCPPVGPCSYRLGEDRCFVGALIDDAAYSRSMEGQSAPSLIRMFVVPSWFRANIDFIHQLQQVHDTETNWPDGRMDMVLELFAAEHTLTLPN